MHHRNEAEILRSEFNSHHCHWGSPLGLVDPEHGAFELYLGYSTAKFFKTERAVEWVIAENSSRQRHPKLTSSEDFSYNVKRRNKNGTVDWQCCRRHKTVNCRGTVKQNGEVFTPRAVAALPHSRTRDDAGPQDSSSRGGGCPEQRLPLSRPDRQQGFSRPRRRRPDAVPPQAHGTWPES